MPVDVDTSFSNLLVKFPRIWEDFVDVSWERQLFDGRKVLKYQLSAVGENYRVERYLPPNEHSFRLLGLKPSSTVNVQLRTLIDSAGSSVWCAWASNSAATLPATEIKVGKIGTDFIHGRICWGSDLTQSGPTPTHTAAPVSKFQVKVRQKGRVLSNDVCEREFPATDSEFSIADIEPNAVLDVQCRAISIYGDSGKWCLPVRFLTLCPVELKVLETGETYSLIEWSRGENDNSSTNEGSIEELVVVVEQLPSQRELDVDSQAKKLQVDAKSFSNETRHYRIKDLLPGRTYVVRSRYRNVLGDWTEWTSIMCKTLHAVRAVDVQLVGHNFVQVRWQREEGDDGTFEDTFRDVKQWEVRCSTADVHASMILEAKENETKIINLHSGIEYGIDVRAQTKSGEWGPWSIPVFVTTLHRLTARVDVAGETWLRVAWDRKEKRYADNVTRYHVQLSCANSPFRLAKYFPPTTLSYTFENLKPGTPYLVAIQAFSDQRWGPWSEPTHTSTCAPCSAELVRRGEDFVHLRWNCEYYRRNAVEPTDQTYQIRLKRPPVDEQQATESSVAPTVHLEDEITQSTYRIPHLPPDSRTLVQVRCFDYTMQSWCEWGPQKEFRTLPPVVVRTQVGETFVEVSWARAPRILSAITDEDFQNGKEDALYPDPAKSYVLRLNTVDSRGGHHEAAKYHFDDGHSTIFTVYDLKPDTLYSLQLSYCDTSSRWSPDSAPMKFRTIPPLRLRVLDVGEGMCSLRWGRWERGRTLITSQDDSRLKIVVKNVVEDAAPFQFNVHDVTQYVVRNLNPRTLYSLQIASAPLKGNVSGGWSDPVYICTTPPMNAELSLVGEDYAQITWERLKRDNLLSALPGARTIVTDSSPAANKVAATNGFREPSSSDGENEGSEVFVGDEDVLEHRVQLFEIVPSEIENTKNVVFDNKLSNTQSTVRIGGLKANTAYEAFVSACVKSKEWGCWSAPLCFKTTMPTEVRVSSITQDAVTIQWGKGDASVETADEDVLRYQLRIEGVDESGYLLEVDRGRNERSYEMTGLSINSCYSVCVRGFLGSENAWGAWCSKIFVVLRSVALEVLETSQDWVLLSWPNRVPPDQRPRSQFLTVVGEHNATITTLSPILKTYIVNDLQPSSLYTVHLLLVEQSPVPVTVTSNAQAAAVATKAESATAGVAPFAMPLIAADFSAYIADGSSFRTQRSLELAVDKVGQNFVLLRWTARVAEDDSDADLSALSSEVFEVEVEEIDCENPQSALLRARGAYLIVRHLRPDSTVRCAVRWVARHSEVSCKWSNSVKARLLPMIEPTLGSGDGPEVPGVGEDYLIVHWKKSLRKSGIEDLSGVTFEVRIEPLEGAHAGMDTVVETEEPSYHFTGLEADTKYQIQVRTVLVIQRGHDDEVEHIKGEWSLPLACTTLSPMAVAVTDVAEEGAVGHWRRKNCAAGPRWWDNVTEEQVKQEIATISSFHVRVTSGIGSDAPTVFDEQFGAQHREFAQCSTRLKKLRPGGTYAISVRASTGMLWGAWSAPVVFRTQLPARVAVPALGETWVTVEWTREVKEGNGMTFDENAVVIAEVVQWDLSFSTVGQDKKRHIVHVPQVEHKNVVGDLQSNCPYTLCVRPRYHDDECGPWSAPLYFVTLAPFKVDVGKVGETFVQVMWEREPQQTITTRMRYKQLDEMKKLDAELRSCEEHLAAIMEVDTDEQPMTVEDLQAQGDSPGERRTAQSREDVNRAKDEEALLGQIAATHEKIQNSKRLHQMQVAELERNAVYPKGDDMKYELVVNGGGEEGDEAQPYLFKRKLAAGELTCRLEGLTPKTTYSVLVRSLFTNRVSAKGMPMTRIEDFDEEFSVPWGSWSTRVAFVTLKPISISARSIGSECFAVDWDTGIKNETISQRTAISRFQIHLMEPKVSAAQQRTDITLEDASLKGHVIPGLQQNSPYSVAVRVCYEGDKWGVWSSAVHFMTMPKLLSRLQSVAERQIEFLIWRDAQVLPEGPNVVVWKPDVTVHQLAINGTPCSQPFSLERSTSTLLTLDTLSVDTQYAISVRDNVVDHWQDYKELLHCETIPFPPQRPTLLERKGYNVAIAWLHKRNLPQRQYVYMVEMAFIDRSQGKREAGPFMCIGYTVAQEFRLVLEQPIHECYFRVRVCKTNQTIDGEPHPIFVSSADPQQITVDNPHIYVWSLFSPIAHFKTPSVPDHPTGLCVTSLTHRSAVLHWNPPANHREHTGLIYRVYLNNNYMDKFTCICETTKTSTLLDDLLPNCHYRVSVTAESTMGSSLQNNTLHFATRVNAEQNIDQPRTRRKDKPLTSTLPPRTIITVPAKVQHLVASTPAAADPDIFSALFDDRASTKLSAAKMTVTATRQPLPREGSIPRRQTQLPPLVDSGDHIVASSSPAAPGAE